MLSGLGFEICWSRKACGIFQACSDKRRNETNRIPGGRCSKMFLRHERDVRPADLSAEPDLKGAELRPLITEQEGAEHFAMRLFRLEPGGYTPFHVHGWEHEVFVLQGTGQVIGEKETLSLEVGAAVYVPPEERHRFQAGDTGLVFLCCVPNTP
ncbi:MAG: cupin domain-containing protein [bacterium]|nr:MAG: cupin domain-containing protein [bacterium]